MKIKRTPLIIYKLFFGLLGFSSIVTEIAVISERGFFNAANFFSYFTIESNVIVAMVFIASAIAIAMKKTGALSILRIAATTYILIVGIGFSVLLAGLENTVFTAVEWNNMVLHYIIPLAALIDIAIDRPRRSWTFRKSLLILLFPIVYVGYSLIRGSSTGWYPYPFLTPVDGQYGPVAVVVAGLVILALGIMALLYYWSSATRSKARPRKA